MAGCGLSSSLDSQGGAGGGGKSTTHIRQLQSTAQGEDEDDSQPLDKVVQAHAVLDRAAAGLPLTRELPSEKDGEGPARTLPSKILAVRQRNNDYQSELVDHTNLVDKVVAVAVRQTVVGSLRTPAAKGEADRRGVAGRQLPSRPRAGDFTALDSMRGDASLCARTPPVSNQRPLPPGTHLDSAHSTQDPSLKIAPGSKVRRQGLAL